MNNSDMMENRFARWASARKRLAWIENRLALGRTVYLSTATKVTKITPKLAASWKADGLELFRADKSGFYIRSGKRWSCADYCKITSSE